jgi:hypothetical protein
VESGPLAAVREIRNMDMLVRDFKGKEAGGERQAAEELGRWNTRVEERKVIDASPAAITCRKPSTGRAPWSGLPKYSPQCRGRRRRSTLAMTTAELEELERKGTELVGLRKRTCGLLLRMAASPLRNNGLRVSRQKLSR